jgi:putative peptidoglycan lipid II flippase
VFYALGANRVPVSVSVATVLVNAALSVGLVGFIGPRWPGHGYLGLPLATSVAALFNCTVLTVLLRRRLGGIEGGRLAGSVVRIAVAAALMGGVAVGARIVMEAVLPGRALAIEIIRLVCTIGVAVAALAGTAFVLRIPEFHQLIEGVTRRLRPSRGR